MANAFIDFSTTAASNTTVGSANVAENCAPSGINNAIRQEIAYEVQFFLDSNTIASAATTDLGTIKEGYVSISGTTTITAFGTPTNKTGYWLKFDGALTLTHNATSLILPSGANIVTAAGDIAYAKHEGSGNWRVLAYQRASGVALVTTAQTLPLGFLAGLTLSNNGADANNDIDISAGSARDGANTADMVLASALTKRMDANWAVGTNQGGLDTGAEANSTHYYVWLIKRVDTGVVDVLFSASATAPTMPTDYTLKRLIGAIYNNASGNLTPFHQRTSSNLRRIMYDTPIVDVAVTNPGTSGAARTLTVPPLGVRAIIQAAVYAGSGVEANHLVSSLDQTDVTPQTVGTASLTAGANVTGLISAKWCFSYTEVDANTSSQIRTRVAGAIADTQIGVITLGWEYEF